MVSQFGNQIIDILENEDRNTLSTFRGMTEANMDKVFLSYKENKKYLDIVILLKGMITMNQTINIYNTYKDKAVKILKKNPYKLQNDIPGFGFLRTDSIAMASGVKQDSVYRVAAAIKHLLDTASTSEGHCFLWMEDIKNSIQELLVPMPKFSDVGERAVSNAVKDWNAKKQKFIKDHDPSIETLDKIEEILETREHIRNALSEAMKIGTEDGVIVNDDGRIYSVDMYKRETECAEMISQMISENPVRFVKPEIVETSIKKVEERKSKEIGCAFVTTEEQRDAVYLGAMHRICIVSGGPGRGKTTICEEIAEAFMASGKYPSKEDIIMLAPTGRAAQRITESTGYSAMTAQRAVMAIKKGEEIPNNKLIICDESSMVDIYLLHSILRYAQKCNLCFVGDVNQIASVGPGKVLKDMIDSKLVPYILLIKGHRNSGSIAHNSDLINAGRKIDNYIYDEHFKYKPCTKDNISDVIIDDYIENIKAYGIENVMLCAAMKGRGPVAVDKLNNVLQEKLTRGHNEAVFGNLKLREGDRVMQCKNDYNFIIKRKEGLKQGIFNGERGTVKKVIKTPDNNYQIIVSFDDGSLGGYTKNTVNNLTLAYATTLHKCQGSEAPCMMMAYVFGDYILLNRALFYTGETRAKKEFRFYGEEKYQYGKIISAFDIAVTKADDTKRNTYLAQRVKLIHENNHMS